MKYLITGGAGFIGSNLAYRLLNNSNEVVIYDNYSREGVEINISWLKSFNFKKLKVVKADIRDLPKLKKYIAGCDVVFHLAAQVAVTTSVINPREDFEINLLGTLNVLETARKQKKMPIVVYSSTNKVYGSLENVSIGNGITETQNLDFHSPYGCSKGAADQYVRDYYRIYGLKTVVFRQSCIYGPRQLGVEDQGWLAHFVIKTIANDKINIFGDGSQVRDLLYIEDLLDAYLLAVLKIEKSAGQVFNIGGGKQNSIDIISAIKLIEEKTNKKVRLKYMDLRPGDQKIFISDNSKAKKLLGFKVKTNYNEGLSNLIKWIQTKE